MIQWDSSPLVVIVDDVDDDDNRQHGKHRQFLLTCAQERQLGRHVLGLIQLANLADNDCESIGSVSELLIHIWQMYEGGLNEYFQASSIDDDEMMM